MKETFKMGWGKKVHSIFVVGVLMELVLAGVALSVNLLYLGLGILVLTALMVWFQCMTFKKNCYVIDGDEIAVKPFGGKPQKYDISKIQRINYVDIGTECGRGAPNARFQLAIYFERKYLKSYEPRLFAPEDRDSFVKLLTQLNPDIIVDTEEKKI